MNDRPISFDGRPYLERIYNSPAQRIVMRCSRQVEKTTFICNCVLHAAVMFPKTKIMVVFPRQEQASVFVKSRLSPVLQQCPAIRKILLGRRNRDPQISHIRFRNDSHVFVRSAFRSADSVRGIDGDFLFIDEFQDVASGFLPVIEECLSHSRIKKIVMTGTPKTIDNHLEDVFNKSTANEWSVKCDCGKDVSLGEDCLGDLGPVCPDCRNSIDPGTGFWLAHNPDSTWADGYTLNHLTTPWTNYNELLERQRTYDPAMFQNECMGRPTHLGDHIVTRAEVEACCSQRPMAEKLADIPSEYRHQLVAGIDWGGGSGASRTVLVIGYANDQDLFHVVYMEKFKAIEEPDVILSKVADRCRQFRVQVVAADGAGNGSVYNNMLIHNLASNLHGLFGIIYSATDQKPQQVRGRLWQWTIGRTPSIGMVFTRVKKTRILLPRLEDSRSFIDEICCEIAEYCDQGRRIKYTHAQTQPDDTLHAINYASTIARYALDQRLVYA